MKVKKAVLSFAMLMCLVVFLAGCGNLGRRIASEIATSDVGRIAEEIMMGDYIVGNVVGDNFDSEWLNLRFTAPEGFIMVAQDEMFEMMQIGLDFMDIDRSLVTWAEMAVVPEMMAMLPDGSVSANVITERVLLGNITIDQYIEAALRQLEAVVGWGVNFNDDMGPVNFAGLEWYAYTVDIHAFGLDWRYQYLVRRFDNRMALVTIYATVDQEAYIDVLMNSFRAY